MTATLDRRAFLALASATTTACSRSAGPGDKALRLATAPSIFQPIYERVAREFEAAHSGVKIVFEYHVREYEEMVQKTLRSDLVGRLPDMSFQGSNYVRLLSEYGVVRQLDDLILADQRAGKLGIAPEALELGRRNGRTYSLPLGLSTPVLLCNADLVRQTGADPHRLPDNWTDILHLARAIERPASRVAGAHFECDANGGWTLMALVNALGGTFMSADERHLTLDGPAGEQAFELVRSFGVTGQARRNMSRDQARQAFGGGSLGILATSSSLLRPMQVAAQGRFEVIACPFPTVPEGKLPTAGGAVVIHATQPERIQAAWSFARFIVGPTAQRIMADSLAWTPVNVSALRESKVAQLDFNPKDPEAAYRKLTGWYAFPGYNSIRISRLIRTYLDEVVTLRLSPAQALAGLCTDIRALLHQAVPGLPTRVGARTGDSDIKNL